jgi:lipopolysaccharide biosynthesis glycosyltransferase
VRLYFMVEDFSSRECQVLEAEAAGAEVIFLRSSSEKFHGLPAFYGSWAIYSRLLLPELVEEDQVLYIDSDTLIQEDLTPLLETELGNHPLGAVMDGTVEWALDKALRTKLGHGPKDGAFNSGVLLFNNVKWRNDDLLKDCLAFGLSYASEKVYDQSILNCLFASSALNIPHKYNSHNSQSTTGAIRHFVGSPKPWDIGGRWLVPGAEAWHQVLAETQLEWRDKLMGTSDVRRALRIGGGYRRALLRLRRRRR